jgi:predicted dehydrogenase
VADPWHIHSPGIDLQRDGSEVERIAVPQIDSYGLEALDLTRAIAGTHPPLLGREDALGQARAIDALYRAAETSQVVVV